MGSSPPEDQLPPLVRWFENIASDDVALRCAQAVAAVARGESERTEERAEAGNSVEGKGMESRLTPRKPRKISRILTYEDLKQKGIHYSRVHLSRLEAAGKFPRRFKLTDNGSKYGAVGWFEHEIDDWIRARAEGQPWRPTADDTATNDWFPAA